MGQGHSSWGSSLLCSPFAWRSNKATSFLFLHNSVSTFLFGIGAQESQDFGSGNEDWEEMNFFWPRFPMTWDPWTWMGKKLHFLFSLTCIWKIAFPSIISVGNKLPSLPEKWAIFRSFDDYCNMLKYCLYLSLPQKYEIIRSATRSKYFMCFWENPHVTLS